MIVFQMGSYLLTQPGLAPPHNSSSTQHNNCSSTVHSRVPRSYPLISQLPRSMISNGGSFYKKAFFLTGATTREFSLCASNYGKLRLRLGSSLQSAKSGDVMTYNT